jgi:hypothetical protein
MSDVCRNFRKKGTTRKQVKEPSRAEGTRKNNRCSGRKMMNTRAQEKRAVK